MARKSFALRTEPHVAEIGDVELLFRPEVMGDEFLDGYVRLREAQKRVDSEGSDLEALREVSRVMREFLAGLMLPESAATFAGMRLPDRVLVELLEWTAELYGGGSGGDRPTGSSGGSAPRSPSPGTRGTVSSRSRASTLVRGR